MTIRADRPRLFFTPELLAAKKAEAAALTPRWKSLVAVTKAAFTETSKDWVPNLALCYVITGEARYARRAYTLLKVVTDQGMVKFTADSGKPAAELMLSAALVYDWCFDQLAETEAINLAARMQAWEDWIWTPRDKPWGVDAPWDNYFHGFTLATWLYGLALGVDAAVNVARDKWLNRALPWLQTEAAGGFLQEGTNYGCGSLVSILMQLAAHKTATGEDLLPGWTDKAMTAKVHQTAPDFIAKAAFGDQASSYPAKHSDTDRIAFLLGLRFADVPADRFWLDTIKPNLNTRGQDFWQEFLFYRTDLVALDYTQWVPTFWVASGAGYLSTRSGWERDAVQVQAVCGKTFSTHQDAAGTFTITRGGDALLGHAKQWSESGIQHRAEFVNCITVNGQGQNTEQDKTAHVLACQDFGRYTLWQCEAGAAYDQRSGSAWSRPLKRWRRTLVFLKPNIVVLYDRVEKNDPNAVVKLHLNMKNPLQGSGLVSLGVSEMSVARLLPAAGTGTAIPLAIGPKGPDGQPIVSSYRWDVAPAPGQPTDEFLVAFQVGATGFVPLPATKTAGGVRVGDDEVIVHEDGAVEVADHRVSPRDLAMLAIGEASFDWEDAYHHGDAILEAKAQALIAAAKALIAVTG